MTFCFSMAMAGCGAGTEIPGSPMTEGQLSCEEVGTNLLAEFRAAPTAWFAGNYICAELPAADLRGINLSGPVTVHIEPADLSRANLTRANFSPDRTVLPLRPSNLTRTRFLGANLTEANMSFSVLQYANLTDANLTEANLTSAYAAYSYLNQAIAIRANLYQTVFISANLSRANLTEANLSEADFTNASFVGANLSRANLQNTNLTGANLTGAILLGANLRGADLDQVIGADFNGTIR